MKRILNYLFFASLSLSISCNHLSNSAEADYSNVTQIQYDEKAESVITIDKIVDRCSFVRLETDKSNLIGRIDQILICDSLIVVVDQHIAKAIFVFNHEGKFLNRISRLGNGHGEYLLINHVAINDKNEVCILDNIKERLLKFDITGDLVASQDLPFKSAKFEFLGNDYILFDVEKCSPLDSSVEDDVEKSCYLLTDSELNIKYTFGKDPSYKNSSFLRYTEAFLKTDGKIYGRLNLGNTIFEFGTDSVKAIYELSLKDDVLYAPSIEDLSTEGLYTEKRLKQPSFSGCFHVCKDYSCYKMMFPERKLLYTWFFKSNKTGSILTLSTESDDPVLRCFDNPLVRWSDNTLVQDISPTTLLARKDDILSNSMVENPEALFDGLTLEDNPVLFFYTFNPDKVDK
jgi:hypothetical protein